MAEFTKDTLTFVTNRQKLIGNGFSTYVEGLWKSHIKFMADWALFLGYMNISEFLYQEFGFDSENASVDERASVQLGALYQSGALNKFELCGERHGV